jgi:hypothetical protein
MSLALVDSSQPSRDLIRTLRSGVRPRTEEVMPESVAWQAFLELRRRGEPDADRLFIQALRSLHDERSRSGHPLTCDDRLPDEHKLGENPYLGELFKAYKKCLAAQRPGPAGVLLQDIAAALGAR